MYTQRKATTISVAGRLRRYFNDKCQERIIVVRKDFNIMRERESLPSHADFLCSRAKPDPRSQKHAALAKRK